jgi:hypothetical protein
MEESVDISLQSVKTDLHTAHRSSLFHIVEHDLAITTTNIT